MKIENFNRAQEIAKTLNRLSDTIKRVESIDTSDRRDLRIMDDIRGAYIDKDLLDPIAKEMCKTAILSNLQGKVKQLEAEFGNL